MCTYRKWMTVIAHVVAFANLNQQCPSQDTLGCALGLGIVFFFHGNQSKQVFVFY